DRLNEQAKTLGVSVSDLQPRFEKFRAFQEKAQVNSGIVRPAFRDRAFFVHPVGGGPRDHFREAGLL
ncbi:MAG: hypothetical protein V4498_10025, partial [candidate division FCPU426 bacterium]